MADAVTKRLFSAQGRKPEKGEVKAIMKRLEHGAIGGSPSCAARNYADAAVTGSKRSEEPPKANKADASTDIPEGVTGSSDRGRSDRERKVEGWRKEAEANADRLKERLLVAEANVERLLGAKRGEEEARGKKVAEANADRLTERLVVAEANVERLLEAKRGEEDVGKKVAEVNADRLKERLLVAEANVERLLGAKWGGEDVGKKEKKKVKRRLENSDSDDSDSESNSSEEDSTSEEESGSSEDSEGDGEEE